ncbi:MAG: ROK family protein [Fimbriimonadaceae bacterium]|jgi:glucokinase|nr:ROK family protein [Fimbriimonadaceae bacterium]
MASECVIGVDLGGTNVRAQALYPDGSKAGKRVSQRSFAQSGTEKIVDQIVLTVREAVESAEGKVKGVGVAIPGHVDDVHGLVRWSPNFGDMVDGVFHYWKNVPLKAAIQDELGLPLVTANDANAAALGEYMFGAGEGKARCLVMFTFGTGVGGGVVMGPESVFGHAKGPLLLVGGNGGGGELGHVTLNHEGMDCTAGTYGAMEAYCQKDALIRRAQYQLVRGRESVLVDMVDHDFSKVTPEHLAKAADQGDELAKEIWEYFGEWMGVGIGNSVNIFAPDIVVIGGQISKAAAHFLPAARKSLRRVAIPSLFSDVEFKTAHHIDDAGIYGGAALSVERHIVEG